DEHGARVGAVDAVELVTIGQRRGLGLAGGGAPSYVVDVDVHGATVVVGGQAALLAPAVALEQLTWADLPVQGAVLAQCSAHGVPRPAGLDGDVLLWDEPQRRVAPGQAVVLYDGDEVVGGGIAV